MGADIGPILRRSGPRRGKSILKRPVHAGHPQDIVWNMYPVPRMSELSNQEIDALLSSQSIGTLACTDGKKPYAFPMAYAYQDNVLYGQTTLGQKLEILRAHPQACFNVTAQAPDGSWGSVMCWGTYEELDFSSLHKAQAVNAIKLLHERLGSVQHQVGISVPISFDGQPHPITVNGKPATLFRIVVTEKSGRTHASS